MNTIKLKDYNHIVIEKVANATITPGMLIEEMSTGKVRKHANAGKNMLQMFAVEDDLQGNGIDDDYSAADQVQCWIPNRGDVVYGILADGNDVSIGDFLESNGAGYLQKHTEDTDSSAEATTSYTNQIVGQAIEAVDTSDSSGGESSGTLGYARRIKVRIV